MGLFLNKQYVGLIKEDQLNYELFMSITKKKIVLILRPTKLARPGLAKPAHPRLAKFARPRPTKSA